MTASLLKKRIWVAGHRGMAGAAVVRKLQAAGAQNLILRSSKELDLRNQADVNQFVIQERPEVVVFCAAHVGGILANKTYPADFIYDNLAMETNSIHAAYQNGVERFLFLGSTAVYPRNSPQPIPESCLFAGPLDESNEAYAIAKIAGIKMCQYYRRQYGVLFHSAQLTNLYGPGDNYHPQHAHVLPSFMRRFHQLKEEGKQEATIWGTGKARREFLHVDDLAEAVFHLLQLDDPPDWVNVGTGQDISIQELAELLADVVGFEGTLVNDLSKPEGALLKRTDCSLIEQTGWSPKIELRQGVERTYRDYLSRLEANSIREH